MSDYATILAHARTVIDLYGGQVAQPYRLAWPPPAAAHDVRPAALPVLRFLASAAAAAPAGPLASLARAIADASPLLAWRQTYREPQVGAAFLDGYGWCAFCGPQGAVPCAALACGALLLGPSTRYPPHAHPAEELYLPLSGAAEWQQGDGPFIRRAPGEAIVHGSGETHTMRTGDAPLLALYVWRGAGLGTAAQLRPAGRD